MRWASFAIVVASAAIAIAGCDRDTPSSGGGAVGEPDPRTALAGSGYEVEFGSQACHRDCSEHEAGYRWAALYGGVNESECAGRSPSFEEGCIAFTRELRRREAALRSVESDDKTD